MTRGKIEKEGRFRIWPAIVAPLGATALTVLAAWLFVAKVDADQTAADAAALRLEGYARLEARELSTAAASRIRSFVEERTVARQGQARNLRLEVRGVMEAVCSLLSANLKRSRLGATARREVGSFPPGFEGMRSFLEIALAGPRSDDALEALRACSTELSDLLPAGCSLAVVEDNSRELLSLGGGILPEGSVSEAMTRDFVFDDGGGSRHWTLRVELSAPDVHPVPEPAEIAGILSERLGDIRLENVAWCGWLIGRDGVARASFPAAGTSAPSLPFIDMPGEWVEIDQERLFWLERASGGGDAGLTPAVAVAIARPAAPLSLGNELAADTRWNVTLGALVLVTLVGWIWFIRALALSNRTAAEEPALEEPAPRSRAGATATRSRLVRDENLSRAIPEVQGIIVANITDDGRVILNQPQLPAQPPKPQVMPSGSLQRLQRMHRGKQGARGSRILDQARSQVLRELAGRVRPPAGDADDSPGARPGKERIAAMKSPLGWEKVDG